MHANDDVEVIQIHHQKVLFPFHRSKKKKHVVSQAMHSIFCALAFTIFGTICFCVFKSVFEKN
jgi:hypothetical protein